MEEKEEKGLYSLPLQKIRSWEESPSRSEGATHQYHFWGGDLKGVTVSLEYISELGVNTLYLTPVFWGYSNHKYDCSDYFTIDPSFGNLESFRELCTEAHKRGMKVIIDGVFNHVGAASRWFNVLGIFNDSGAFQSKESPYSRYFIRQGNGFRTWANSKTLPELDLDNPELTDHLFDSENSVVRYWIRQGADGWRLDCAYDLGYKNIRKIVDAARGEKPDALITGEIWNHPSRWEESGMHGIMNYCYRGLLLDLVRGDCSGESAGRVLQQIVETTDQRFLRASWNMISSHDVPRISTAISDEQLAELAIALQYAFPGNPLIYYGEELEMEGGDDPENRGPMRWDYLREPPTRYFFYKELNRIRSENPAFTRGECSLVHSSKPELLAFKLYTERIDELVVVVANPTQAPVTTTLYLCEPMLMNGTSMRDIRSSVAGTVDTGRLRITVAAKSFFFLVPAISRYPESYSPYKRV